METQTYAQKLQAKIKGYLETLASETDKARTSEEMVRYLDFCSKFYRYSPTNIWLIMFAMPTASMVAGYSKWRSMERVVMKGQKAIWILAPIFYKELDSDGKEVDRVYGFKPVPVFDISQTSGKPLPPPPNWKSPGQNNELRKRLMEFASSKGIIVNYEEFADDTQGESMGGKISLSPASGVKTLAHELVHEILHQSGEKNQSRMEIEFEAESAAYIICRYFGMNDLASPNYNALQGSTGVLILQHYKRILSAATEIINAITNNSLDKMYI